MASQQFHHTSTYLSLRTTRSGVDSLMQTIMRDLPGAEFGSVQSSISAATH